MISTTPRDLLGDFKRWIDARTSTDRSVFDGDRTIVGTRLTVSSLSHWVGVGEARLLKQFSQLEPTDCLWIRMFSYMDPILRERVIAGEDPKPNKVMFCSCEDGKLDHFYPSQLAVKLCFAPRDVYQILEIELVADPQGSFWCWHCFKKNDYGMVYPDLRLLSMCFPYGVEGAEAVGHGVRVQVRVDVINENPAPEDRSRRHGG